MRIYLDTEFDAVKIEGKHKQKIISIGAVMTTDNFQFVSTFYDCVRPEGFEKLSSVVSRITNLSNEQILKAKPFSSVVSEFMTWLQKYTNNNISMYCFGPDDIRTLVMNCEDLQIDATIFQNLIDIQKELSSYVTYEQQLISSFLSLDDLKAAYRLAGEVEHNALSDAFDLQHLHQAYLQKQELDASAIKVIMLRRKKSAEEGRQKWMKQHLIHLMKPLLNIKLKKIQLNQNCMQYLKEIGYFKDVVLEEDNKCRNTYFVQFVKKEERFYIYLKLKCKQRVLKRYIPFTKESYPLFTYCLDEVIKQVNHRK